MENLYIQVDGNGNFINHPAFEGNLISAFNSIPSNWEQFLRVEKPHLKIYQVLDSEEPLYQKINGIWTDVWFLREMTSSEKLAKQQKIKDEWLSQPQAQNWASWTFDEATCAYQPPTPRPTEGNFFWQDTTLTWVSRPEYPTDGKAYKLDFASATWVEVTP